MAQETITILGFDIKTQDAVQNVADLRENIKNLKKVLDDETASKEDNAKAAELLRQNQYALRDAMYATSSSADDLIGKSKDLLDDNKRLNGSYNDLVHTMAELKSQWRATTNEVERANLGREIDKINSQLKDMDASVGVFGRNVGDYANSIKSVLGDIPSFADPVKKSLKDVGDTMGILSKNPLIGIVSLLFPLIMKITENVKESEGAMKGVNQIMTAMKPVMSFFQGVLDKVVAILGDIIGKVAEFVTNNGLFSKIVEGCVGVGNAVLQFIVAPFKGVIAAIKVFQEEGVKGFRDAGKAFAREMNSGVAFKSNFQAGQAMADGIVAGAKSKKADVEKAGKETGESFVQGFEKALAESEKINEARRKLLEESQSSLDALVQADMDAMNAEIDNFFAEEAELLERQRILREMDEQEEQERFERQKERTQARIDTLYAVADATASILSSIADMYEADEANAQKNAQKVKALRIATATIDTITGAIGAFATAAANPGGIPGMIIGAANAAAVTAAGIANIAKIRSTNLSGGSTSTSAPTAPAVTSAPKMSMDVQQVRNVTSASEEDRLNKIANDQKVYLVMSELEATQNQTKVQMAEATF